MCFNLRLEILLFDRNTKLPNKVEHKCFNLRLEILLFDRCTVKSALST